MQDYSPHNWFISWTIKRSSSPMTFCLYPILITLDLRSAFDTVDHNVLISCRHQWCGSVDRFISRCQTGLSLLYSEMPPPLLLFSFVGSPRASLLYTMDMPPLDINLHCYADDTQPCVPLKPGTTDIIIISIIYYVLLQKCPVVEWLQIKNNYNHPSWPQY